MVFRWKCKPKHGFGVHSPFVFNLYTNVIDPDKKESVFDDIEKYRRDLKKSGLSIIRKTVNGKVIGNAHGEEVSLKKITSGASIPSDLGRLLYRINHNLDFENVVELGTSVGISTLYLATGNPTRPVYTIEAEESIIHIAQSRFRSMGYCNITGICGDFQHELPMLLENLQTVGLVFIDGNHNGEALKNYMNTLSPAITENTVVVIDDIRWSSQMEAAWHEISSNKNVTVSLDLFRCGVLIYKKGIRKQNFMLRYGRN